MTTANTQPSAPVVANARSFPGSQTDAEFFCASLWNRAKKMAAMVQLATAGDWRSVLKLSITTGIVVAQSESWDRTIGRVLGYIFQDTDSEPA